MSTLDEIETATVEHSDGVFYECPRHGRYAGSGVFHIPEDMTWLLKAHQSRRVVRDKPNCEKCADEAKAAHEAWKRRSEMADRWAAAGVPRLFRNRRFDNFRANTPQLRKACDAVKAWCSSDIPGLLLIGPPGLGKSHLAAACVATLVRKGLSTRYALTPDLLSRMRASFDRDSDEHSRAIVAEMTRSDCWVLDEIGATGRTEWERLQLSDFIDERYRNEASFVLIGNVAASELASVVGERGADRLTECAIVVPVTGPSYRPKAINDSALRCPDDFDPGDEPDEVICVRGVMQVTSQPTRLAPLPSRYRR